MYFPDLTSSFYEDAPHAQYVSRTPAVYVGWLAPEEGHEVQTGPVPEDFVEALRWAIKQKSEGGPFHDGMGTRGFHTCMLSECPKGRESGGGYHLTIPGEKRDYYVPVLIRHYVEHHQYQPPQEFVEAVMAHWREHKGIQENQGARDVIRRMLHE